MRVILENLGFDLRMDTSKLIELVSGKETSEDRCCLSSGIACFYDEHGKLQLNNNINGQCSFNITHVSHNKDFWSEYLPISQSSSKPKAAISFTY